MTDSLIIRFSSRLLGPDAGIGFVLITGFLLGALPAVDAQQMLLPFVLFIVPAWFFYVGIRLNSFLCHPRTIDLGFVAGVEYDFRIRMARRFFNRKSIEIAGIALTTAVSLAIVRGLRFGVSTMGESAGFGLVLVGAVAVFFALFKILMVTGVFSPVLHDPKRVWEFIGFRNIGLTVRSRMFLPLARRIGSIVPPPLSTIFARQFLYLLRVDLFGFASFNLATLPLTALLVWFTRGVDGPVITILVGLAPLVIYSVMTETMSVSADCYKRCGYYEFSTRDIYLVNLILASAVAAPYLLLYGAKVLITFHGSLPIAVGLVSAFTFSLAAVSFSMANRWTHPHWTGTSLFLTVLAVVCSVLGNAVPVWGICFPLFSCAVTLLPVIGTGFFAIPNDPASSHRVTASL